MLIETAWCAEHDRTRLLLVISGRFSYMYGLLVVAAYVYRKQWPYPFLNTYNAPVLFALFISVIEFIVLGINKFENVVLSLTMNKKK